MEHMMNISRRQMLSGAASCAVIGPAAVSSACGPVTSRVLFEEYVARYAGRLRDEIQMDTHYVAFWNPDTQELEVEGIDFDLWYVDCGAQPQDHQWQSNPMPSGQPTSPT